MNKNAVLESLKRIVSLYLDTDNEMREELLKDACEKAVPIIADNENECWQYGQVVIEAADDLLSNFDLKADDLDDETIQGLHKIEESHPWVLNDELAAIVLMQSDNPIAEWFNSGSPDCNSASDPFPFRSCAAGALTEDVKDYIYKNYKVTTIAKAAKKRQKRK
jgi:hypothetical protein